MLKEEIRIATELAKAAGKIVMQYYDQDYRVDMKKENEPVTQADRASNEFITSQLLQNFPEDGILAEESKDNLTRLSKRRVWLVDPMDGTREFIDKIGEFSIMVGLVEDGHPILGVVYQPTTGILYSAAQKLGSFISKNGEQRRLRVSELISIPEMTMVVSRSHRAAIVDKMKNALGLRKEVSSGSVGLKVGLMVENKCDLYLHPNSKTKEWDTCAPEIILQEAGGQITDCWGEGLRYNKQNVYNDKGFVASNGRCHSQILNTISPFLNELT